VEKGGKGKRTTWLLDLKERGESKAEEGKWDWGDLGEKRGGYAYNEKKGQYFGSESPLAAEKRTKKEKKNLKKGKGCFLS